MPLQPFRLSLLPPTISSALAPHLHPVSQLSPSPAIPTSPAASVSAPQPQVPVTSLFQTTSKSTAPPPPPTSQFQLLTPRAVTKKQIPTDYSRAPLPPLGEAAEVLTRLSIFP